MGGGVDLVRRVLAWIAVGLLLGVLFARGAASKKKEEKAGDYGSEGMCLGMCFGTAIGTSLGNNTGIGMTLGMLVGLAIGSSIKKKKQDDEHDKQG